MNKDELINLQKKVSLLRAEGDYKETIKKCYKLYEAKNLEEIKYIINDYQGIRFRKDLDNIIIL